jgi:hypothetical protein
MTAPSLTTGCIRLDVRGVLLDPLARDLQALVGACLVLAHGHGHTAVATAQQRVAHETGYLAQRRLDVALVLIEHVEELLRAAS